MTTLVGVQGDGWAVLGCDSRATLEDGRILEIGSSKIIENNNILIAGAGGPMGQMHVIRSVSSRLPGLAVVATDVDDVRLQTVARKVEVKRANEGTGLGLPMAVRLTELHGGTLHVDSVKNKGTTITVRFPAGRVG